MCADGQGCPAYSVIAAAAVSTGRRDGMSELSVLQAFVAAGMTPVGACAMGGNIQAESGFKSNIAQRGMTKLSDEEYTKAADDGTIDFAHDAVGYGLCQWTYWSRKDNLMQFAKDYDKSVGDKSLQIDFCIAELKQMYPLLWRYLCETQDITAMTDRICREYEKPAVNNTSVRTMYANQLYMQYGAELATMGQVNPSTVSTGDKKTALDFTMPTIKRGDRSPEARYLADKLSALGYDVLWSGLWAALVDYQGKRGLKVDGICGAETWAKLMQEGKG